MPVAAWGQTLWEQAVAEWRVGRKGTEVQLFKMTQAVRSHECENNGVIYQEYLVQGSGIVINLSSDLIIIREIT